MSFVAIDFETATGSTVSACAVGWAVVDGDSVRESGSQLIDPKIPAAEWAPFNIALHGIHPSDVRGAPSFPEVWAQVLSLSDGRPFVAHYAAFDTRVIREEHKRFGLQIVPFRFICSARLSQVAWPSLLSVSLPVVADSLGLKFEHHDARSDAETAAAIAIAAVRELGAADLDSAVAQSQLLWGEVRPLAGVQAGQDTGHPLYGKVVVFTGELQTMPRGEAHRLVLEAGGTPGNSVSKKTSILVSGDQDFTKFAPGELQSSKFRKAQELRNSGCDIQLIAEEDFLKLL